MPFQFYYINRNASSSVVLERDQTIKLWPHVAPQLGPVFKVLSPFFFFNEMTYIYKWYVSGGFGASFFSNLNETVKHCTNFPLKFTVCAVVLEQS